MNEPDSVIVPSGIVLLSSAAAIFAVAIATRQMLGPLAMTVAQLGVLAFYWFPWSHARRSREPIAAIVFGVLSLVVSLLVIGGSGAVLVGAKSPFLVWGPFLIVHLAGNIALATRPRVYLCWIIGVWVAGPLALGLLVLYGVTFPHDRAPVELLLRTFIEDTGGSNDWPGAIRGIFWLFSLAAFVGTAAGLGLALMWRRRRLEAESKETPSGVNDSARGENS